MIKFDLRISLLLIATLLAAPSLAQAVPFQTGEKICYNVKQLGVKAGDAVLYLEGDTFVEGQKYTLIVFRAQGFNFYDEERIFVDGATWLPQRVMRDLNIFGKKEQITEDYFHQDGYVRITKIANGKTTVQRYNTKGPVDNLYGFLYRYRLNGSLRIGDEVAMQLPTMRVNIQVKEAMKFKAAGKTYHAVLMRSVPAKYSLWFDISEKRLPLRIAGALGLSNTVMTMVECDK